MPGTGECALLELGVNWIGGNGSRYAFGESSGGLGKEEAGGREVIDEEFCRCTPTYRRRSTHL